MRPINKTYVFMNFVYLVIVSAIVARSLTFSGEGGIVPIVIGVPTLVLVLISLAAHLFPSLARSGSGGVAPAAAELQDVASWARGAVIIGWVVGFFVLIFLIGFYPSIPLFTLAFLTIEGRVPWVKAAITAAILWAVVYVSFDMLMHQALFKGILFRALVPNF